MGSDPAKYIARALSPARVTRVFLEEELDTVRTATVIVPEDQLSLAIGKEGQNARLAAKLTGWRIDIKSVVEAAMTALMLIHDSPLSAMKDRHPELLDEAFRILEKKENNRAVTPEEYARLTKFVETAEALLHNSREETRQERRDAIDMVRPLVPPVAFQIPLRELELAEDIMKVIDYMGNVGELWVRFMADEEGLNAMLAAGGAAPDAMDAIRDALDDLVVPEVVEEDEDETQAAAEVEAALPEPTPEPEPAAPPEEAPVA
ncbi:MAG: hypothetical protein HC915_15475, partial [Anaerolineae bacterium]|nr:hypothetical protein [Anaerolineae bacterium]